MSKFLPFVLATLATFLAGCQTVPSSVQLPAPLNLPAKGPANSGVAIASERTAPTATAVQATPTPPPIGKPSMGLHTTQNMPPLSGQPITVALNNLPLPAFINAAYGDMLHVNFVLDPSLAKQSDLVTLRVTEPQSPQTFYRLVDEVLRRYGIASTWDGRVLNITLAKNATSSEPPILISGRALPNVPESHRPMFQLVELHAVGNTDVAQWLRTAYGNDQLKVSEDINRNAVMISGPPDLVQQAVQAVAVLDRPYLRGSHSRRISPAFIAADQLAPRLVEALRAEGFAANTTVAPGSAIIVLPVAAANSLLVFAPDEKTLDHVIAWARTIDQPNPASSKDSVFYYPVTNTKAADIAAILNGSSSTRNNDNLSMGTPAATPAAAGATPAAPAANANNNASNRNGTVIVDEPRNALVFRGDPAEWQRLVPLIKQMDRAARQVMIEVTIAEVTLDDGEQFGVNWLAKDSHGKFNGLWQMGTLASGAGTGTGTGTGNGTGSGNGSGSSSSGLSYLVDVAGMNRAQLTAIAQDQRVSILSTPRIMVKSGEEANIDVGTEVPTLTAQTTSAQQTEGSSNLLQSIQYRKTGIILNVKPTVYSDNRIDLDISQEVSEAQPLDSSSGVSSPSILNRSLKTSLSLMDGGSVVLGGLVSTKDTKGNNGVPFLKDIPVLGHLFKSQSRQKSRTELLVIIVPYIIESNQQAKAVTNAVISSMPSIQPADLRPLTPTPPPAMRQTPPAAITTPLR